jgi:hypothetical protein
VKNRRITAGISIAAIALAVIAILLSPALEWVNKYGQGLSALAAVATAWIAIGALRSAARDSTDRSRPVVVAEFQLAEESDTSLDLVIHNYGLTLARNLKVTFDGDILSGVKPNDRDGGGQIVDRYARTIGVLSPGQSLTNTWWFGVSRAGEDGLVNGHGLPDEVSVSVAYEALDGNSYSDTFDLHVSGMLLTTRSYSSTSMRGAVNNLAKSVKKIADRRIPSSTIATSSTAMTAGSVPQQPIFVGKGESQELVGSDDV